MHFLKLIKRCYTQGMIVYRKEYKITYTCAQYITNKGRQCRNGRLKNSHYCHIHHQRRRILDIEPYEDPNTEFTSQSHNPLYNWMKNS